jgi:hypothetical protein
MSDPAQHLNSSPEMAPLWRRKSFRLLLVALAFFICPICLMRWGGYWLLASDPLPSHSDVAVALQGSIAAQSVRIDGAVSLLRQGIVPQVILSVPKKSYWGESLPPVARRYLESRYGSGLAARVDFCETGPEVNSTEDEASGLVDCIRQRGWQSIIVVTSDYHTRRAGLVWRNTLQKQGRPLRLWVHGVVDPEFQPQHWWRHRLYAKTWILESMKLVWVCMFDWEN